MLCVKNKMGSRQSNLIDILQESTQPDPYKAGSEAQNVLIRLNNLKSKSICTDIPSEYEAVFPGYTVEAYNMLVPQLVEMGWLEVLSESPRDGVIVNLSNKAQALLGTL